MKKSAETKLALGVTAFCLAHGLTGFALPDFVAGVCAGSMVVITWMIWHEDRRDEEKSAEPKV